MNDRRARPWSEDRELVVDERSRVVEHLDAGDLCAPVSAEALARAICGQKREDRYLDHLLEDGC